MASNYYYKQAEKQIGKLDTSMYDEQRKNLKNTYNTNKSAADTNWQNLQDQITANRQSNSRNFTSGRNTVAENSYTNERANRAALASRGIGGNSGLQQLSQLGNRMETGKQYADLANTYYDTEANLDTTYNQGQDAYNLDLETLLNSYNTDLANINATQKQAEQERKYRIMELANQLYSQDLQSQSINESIRNNKDNMLSRAASIAAEYANDNSADYKTIYDAIKLGTGSYLSDKEISNIINSKANTYITNSGISYRKNKDNTYNLYNTSSKGYANLINLSGNRIKQLDSLSGANLKSLYRSFLGY